MPREVGAWTRDKLLVLSRYLPLYLQVTTKALERFYIDGFAGPGTNQIEKTNEVIHGSPLVAMNSAAANGTRFTKLFYIENDPLPVAELRDTLARRANESPYEVIEGDINDELPEVIRRISRRSPTLIFLDTQGIEPRWSTIEAISDSQVEFLINFPLGMSINRNPDSQKTLEYFGTPECLPILASGGADRTRRLLDLYKSRLAGLGLIHTTENDLLVKTPNNQRLYYLIHVSKVKPAKSMMDWVFEQPDSRGQRRLPL